MRFILAKGSAYIESETGGMVILRFWLGDRVRALSDIPKMTMFRHGMDTTNRRYSQTRGWPVPMMAELSCIMTRLHTSVISISIARQLGVYSTRL